MKKYKAFISQGDGCDYTIGCGKTVINLDADSLEKALEQFIEIVRKEYSGEYKLESAEVYEINEIHSINMKKLYEGIYKDNAHQALIELEEEEKREFERLKQKFESK